MLCIILKTDLLLKICLIARRLQKEAVLQKGNTKERERERLKVIERCPFFSMELSIYTRADFKVSLNCGIQTITIIERDLLLLFLSSAFTIHSSHFSTCQDSF